MVIPNCSELSHNHSNSLAILLLWSLVWKIKMTFTSSESVGLLICEILLHEKYFIFLTRTWKHLVIYQYYKTNRLSLHVSWCQKCYYHHFFCIRLPTYLLLALGRVLPVVIYGSKCPIESGNWSNCCCYRSLGKNQGNHRKFHTDFQMNWDMRSAHEQ